MDPDKTDVFPDPETKTDPDDVPRLPVRPKFRELVQEYPDTKKVFVIYLVRMIVYYKLLAWDEYQKHFENWAKTVDDTVKTNETDLWPTALNRLQKNPNGCQKNADVRTCFKWGVNFFLVKSSFTFGLRHVESGTAHVYQIGPVGVRLFFLNPLYRAKNWNRREKFFPVNERNYYVRRTLRPHESYAVPAGTSYFVFTTTRCFFSVHVVDVSRKPLPFSCVNPLKQAEKRKVDDPYRLPVKTPRIEEVDDRDRPETRCPEGPCTSTDDFGGYYRGPCSSSASRPPPEEDGGEEDGPCSSSGIVLMDLENGDKITEDGALMPPPPPPSQTFIIAMPVQLDRTVKVVDPDTAEWYARNFKYRVYPSPLENVPPSSTTEEPLDLTCRRPPEIEIVYDAPVTPAVEPTAPAAVEPTAPAEPTTAEPTTPAEPTTLAVELEPAPVFELEPTPVFQFEPSLTAAPETLVTEPTPVFDLFASENEALAFLDECDY